MKYFEYSQTIDNTDIHIISTISTDTWKMILKIIDDMKGNFPILPSTVANNIPRDYLSQELVVFFDNAGLENLNCLHKACQYLKFDALKKAIAIYLACKVYFNYNSKSYQERKRCLQINRDITEEKTKMFKERYPFIN